MSLPVAMNYLRGEVAVVTDTFTNPRSQTTPVDPVTGNTLVDPANVFVDLRPDGGVVTTYTYGVDPAIVRLGPGTYQFTTALSTRGEYEGKFYGTGANATNTRFTLIVEDDTL